jgi:hypothetical protein
MIKNSIRLGITMKRASIAWDETGKWLLFLAVAIAVLIIIIAVSGGIGSVWDRIKAVLTGGLG